MRSLLRYFGGSMIKALIHLFPDVPLERSKFAILSSISPLLIFPINAFTTEKYWNDVDNRKAFFLEFAKKCKFDALVAENWYKISRVSIAEAKVYSFLASFFTLVC